MEYRVVDVTASVPELGFGRAVPTTEVGVLNEQCVKVA